MEVISISNYDFKIGKNIEIIKEFQKSGNVYDINGVDTDRAFFMYRKFQEAFQVLAPGSYTLYEEAGNLKLKIVDETVLADAIEFQVIYVFTPKSSQYNDDFPDLEILQRKYNELQQDFIDVTNILKKINITGDTLKMFYVLPELNENEVWVRTVNGYRGFNIGSIEENIKAFWEEFRKSWELVTDELDKIGQEKVEEVNQAGVNNVESVNNAADEKIQEIAGAFDNEIAQGKIEITEHTNTEIDRINATGIDGKLTKVDTIVQLQATDFQVGEVVEVLGYYDKTDGATHKRVIAESDNGSGVQLNNGLWANIIHNGEVNVSWFGTKGDGITDDSIKIQKCFDFRPPVIVFPSGTFMIKNTLKPLQRVEIKGQGVKKTIFTSDLDIDIFQIYWRTTLRDCTVISTYPAGGSYGLIRFQNYEGTDTKTDEEPFAYMNKLINVEATEGSAYNIACVNIGYTLFENIDCTLCKGEAGIILDGEPTSHRFGTTLTMEGTNRITANKGLGMLIRNQLGHKIKAIIEGNGSSAIKLEGYAKDIELNCYFENNCVFTTSNEDSILWIDCNRLEGLKCNSLFDRTNRNIYCVNVTKTEISGVAINDFSGSYYEKNDDLFMKNSSNLRFNMPKSTIYSDNIFKPRINNMLGVEQSLYSSGTSKIKNSNFKIINGKIEGWSLINMVNTGSGIFGSKNAIYSNVDYPASKLQQVNIQENLENEVNIPCLVFIGRGKIVGTHSVELNQSFKSRLIIGTKDSGNIFIDLNEIYLLDINKPVVINLSSLLAPRKFPNKTNITGMTLELYPTNGTLLRYVGMFDLNAPFFYHDDSNVVQSSTYAIETLNTPYHVEKMKSEGVYTDFVNYMDAEVEYKSMLKKKEERDLESYNLALQSNPDLTYDEFMARQPLMLMAIEEPQPSKKLLEFAKKYL